MAYCTLDLTKASEALAAELEVVERAVANLSEMPSHYDCSLSNNNEDDCLLVLSREYNKGIHCSEFPYSRLRTSKIALLLPRPYASTLFAKYATPSPSCPGCCDLGRAERHPLLVCCEGS